MGSQAQSHGEGPFSPISLPPGPQRLCQSAQWGQGCVHLSAFLRPLPPSQSPLECLLPVLFPFCMPGPAWAPGLVAGGQGTLGPVSSYF